MIPGIDENFDRVCRHLAAVVVSALVAFTFGMWLLRDTVLPQCFAASALCAIALAVDTVIVRRRAPRSPA